MKLMYRNLIICLVFIGFTMVSNAQNKYVVEANSFFNSQKYCEGAEKCSLAYSKLTRKGDQAKKTKADMAFKTAECYRLTDHFLEANEWYDRALLLDYQDVNPEIFYYNGEMLRMMGEFEKAQKNYEEYLKLVPSDNRGEVGIQSCKDSKSFVANRSRHVVTREMMNENEYDMAPMFADRKETKMYFASSREGSTGNASDPISCEKYMDIWVSELDKKGNWGEPRLADVSGLINTEAHEGSATFTGNGKTMFFTRCPNENKQNLGCDIWMAELKGKNEWSDTMRLKLKPDGADSITVGHPCVSDDGKFLIFVSNLPGGYGGRDLWYSEWDKKLKGWGAPKNMGPEVNTKGNELFPTFAKNGDLLFATDGLPGLGGLDIFRAKKVVDAMKWENPANLGYPINSENNDYSLYELTDRKGYFTSERKDPNGKFNADIYMYELPPNLFDLKVIVSEVGNASKKLADVRVVVKGNDGATWEGKTNASGSVFWDKKPNADRYILENSGYTINISKTGYHENKTGSSFTTVGLDEDQNFVQELQLMPIKPIRLPEVRYPLSKWTFVNDSTISSDDSLMFVYNLLQEYPEMLLELSSHTDARDTDKRNQVLSENRAKACYKFLIDKGIDPRRIVPVGKGEATPATWIDPATGQPVVLTEAYINTFKKTDPAKFEKLHQLNRRTEGRVINMMYDPATAPAAPAIYLQFQPIPKK